MVATGVGIGGKGVDVFVVLSGFCLFYPVVRRHLNQKSQRSLGEFYRRRALRILPVYFSAIIFSLVLIYSGAQIALYRGLWDIVPHIFLIQNAMPDYTGRINGPLWSVALEAQLYLFFPFVAMLWLRGHSSLIIVGAALTSIAANLIDMTGYLSGAPLNVVVGTALPARLIQFCLGMLVAWCLVSQQRIQLRWWIVVAIGMLPIALYTTSRTGADSLLRILYFIAWGQLAATSILVGHYTTQRWRWISMIAKPLEWLGLISFSFYALHFPIMFAIEPYVQPFVTGPTQGIMLFLITGFPVMLAAACGLYWGVERHFISTGSQNIGKQTRVVPDPMPETANMTTKSGVFE